MLDQYIGEEDNIYRKIMYLNINDITLEFMSNYLLTCNAQFPCLEINIKSLYVLYTFLYLEQAQE